MLDMSKPYVVIKHTYVHDLLGWRRLMSYPKAGHIYTFLYYPTQGPNDLFAAENKPS